MGKLLLSKNQNEIRNHLRCGDKLGIIPIGCKHLPVSLHCSYFQYPVVLVGCNFTSRKLSSLHHYQQGHELDVGKAAYLYNFDPFLNTAQSSVTSCDPIFFFCILDIINISQRVSIKPHKHFWKFSLSRMWWSTVFTAYTTLPPTQYFCFVFLCIWSLLCHFLIIPLWHCFVNNWIVIDSCQTTWHHN